MYNGFFHLYTIAVDDPIPNVSINPCSPSPCGPNAACQPINDSPSCSCLATFIGSPPNCRPECASNAECANHLACIRNKCVDPCPGVCGANAECRVVSHTAMCVCISGHVGDPFSHCSVQQTPVVHDTPLTPCVPSPCGSNALCREQNGAGACVCLPEYVGNPYEGCRPECVLNSDCAANRACVQAKCQDPCPGACAQLASCQVVNHLPSCTCPTGFTGDASRYCSRIPDDRKSR